MAKTNLRMAIVFIAVLTAIIAVRARTAGTLDTAAGSQVSSASGYDMVIANGRVMDPETGLDAVRNVGITAGKIRAISVEPLKGKTVLDAKGLVVAPGFIDLHEHAQEPRNYQFQAHDGVTTSLELEVGTDDVDAWYAKREGKTLINFGVSVRPHSGAHESDARPRKLSPHRRCRSSRSHSARVRRNKKSNSPRS